MSSGGYTTPRSPRSPRRAPTHRARRWPRISRSAAIRWGDFIAAQLALTQAPRSGADGADLDAAAAAVGRARTPAWTNGVERLARARDHHRRGGLRRPRRRALSPGAAPPAGAGQDRQPARRGARRSPPRAARALSIGYSAAKIGDAGVAQLVACPKLAGLRYLDIARQGITQAGARMPDLGKALERTYGDLLWLHGIRNLRDPLRMRDKI